MEKRDDLTYALFKVLKEKEDELRRLKEEVKTLTLLIKKERRDLEHFQRKWQEEENLRNIKNKGEIISSLLHIYDSIEGLKVKLKMKIY